MLTCSIIENVKSLCSEKEGYAIGYFYCDGNYNEKKESRYILGSILRQLLSCCYRRDSENTLDAELKRFYNQNKDRNIRASELVQQIGLQSSGFKKAFVIVDGLDECNMPSEICSLLLKCVQAGTLNIWATSRPKGNIRGEFSGHPQLGLDDALVQTDIETYIDWRLAKDRGFARVNRSFKDEIKTKLINESQGMYISQRFMSI
jgi:hypothetical protein